MTALIPNKSETTKTPSQDGVGPGVSTAERTLLLHQRRRGGDDDSLEELRLLTQSAGALVIDLIVSARRSPEPATFFGKGKLEEVKRRVEQDNVELVVINNTISPVQERNLERNLCCRVLDRTGLILDIFAQRARSHEGKLQVELAQLRHLSTRLVRGWTHLERQKGGIGLRGPGETQLETDRRLIGIRIKQLQRRLQRVETQRALRRKARRKVPIPTVSMVGYTNAGKSSLFNCLTAAGVYEADKLFATLDTTMRRVELPGFGPIVLSDTVGFIRDLPHSLVKAFHSTLEEVREARVLLHVVDSANPERKDCMQHVDRVLEEIGASERPVIEVFNKIDLSGRRPGIERDRYGRIRRVWLSAHTGEGADLLLQAMVEELARHHIQRRFCLPPEAGRLRASMYQRLNIVQEETTPSGGSLLDVDLGPADLGWMQSQPDYHQDYLIEEENLPERVFASGSGA